jgi:hypothetical protein
MCSMWWLYSSLYQHQHFLLMMWTYRRQGTDGQAA